MTWEERIGAIHYFEEVETAVKEAGDYCKLAIEALKKERVTGHWIKRLRHQNAVKRYTGKDVITGEIHTIQILERYDYIEYYCSECGSICGDVSMNYCCVCGAMMIEPQESEDKNE